MRVTERWTSDSGDEVDKTDLFCPNCGQQSVFEEKGEGDYYTGPSHYCTSCKSDFKLPYLATDQKFTIS